MPELLLTGIKYFDLSQNKYVLAVDAPFEIIQANLLLLYFLKKFISGSNYGFYDELMSRCNICKVFQNVRFLKIFNELQ